MKSFMKSRIVQARAPRGRIARAIVALAFAGLFTAACKDTSGPETLSTLTITPTTATIAVNGTVQFTAAGTRSGANVTLNTPVWSVTGGGTISSSGLFTAGPTPGTSTVTVTCGGISSIATVTVTAGPPATITVTPDPATLPILTTVQFTAVVRDANGNPITATPVWSVVNGGGSINATGLFTAGSTTGTFPNTVRASSGALADTATVIVTAGAPATITVTPDPATLAINTTQQFTAEVRDAGGNVIVVTPVWSVVNGGGSINATGLFTAGNTTGTFSKTVRAGSGALADTATVIVTAPAPPPSPLGSAANFGILAGQGITCAISGTVNGATGTADIGSMPLIVYTGFFPPPAVCTFTGIIPGSGVVQTAKDDLTVAYLAAQAEVCDLNISGSDLGFYDGTTPAKTLPPGVYCFSTSAGLTGTLNLTGSATDTWTFQIGSTLIAETGSQVILAGGAIPDNVTWAVGSSATLRTNAAFQGNIMALQSITLENGVILLGRALAQVGAVDMTAGAATITIP